MDGVDATVEHNGTYDALCVCVNTTTSPLPVRACQPTILSLGPFCLLTTTTQIRPRTIVGRQYKSRQGTEIVATHKTQVWDWIVVGRFVCFGRHNRH